MILIATCFGHHYARHQELKSYTDSCCLWDLALWFTGRCSGVELWVVCPVCWMLLRHLVGLLFPRINDDARSNSHQALSSVSIHQMNLSVEPNFSSVSDSPVDYFTTQLQHLASSVIRCPQSSLKVLLSKYP